MLRDPGIGCYVHSNLNQSIKQTMIKCITHKVIVGWGGLSKNLVKLNNFQLQCSHFRNIFRIFSIFSFYLLMLDTLGTFSWLQIPSVNNRSRISQANIVGFSFLYLLMASTTGGVATLGLLPPITPAL